jgi:hypothetical protein
VKETVSVAGLPGHTVVVPVILAVGEGVMVRMPEPEVFPEQLPVNEVKVNVRVLLADTANE